MEKFKIIPKQSRSNTLFNVLVHTKNFSPQIWNETEIALLKNALVKHVEISPKKKSWEIWVGTTQLLNETFLKKTSLFLCKENQLNDVFFYQDTFNLDETLTKYFPAIIQKALKNEVVLSSLMKDGKFQFDNGKLTIKFFKQSALLVELIKKNHVTQKIQQTIGEMTGFFPEILIEFFDETEAKQQKKSQSFSRETIPVHQVSLQASHTAPKTKPVSYASAPVGASFAASAQNFFNNESRPVRRKKIITSENFLYGSSVEGKLLKIEQILSEQKNCCIQGVLVNVEGREMQNVNLITMDIADETNGITIKIFFKQKEEFFDRLKVFEKKVNALVRAAGSVRFDKFQNDFIFFAEGIQEEKQTLREDLSPEKRVELHAHTQMSDLDSVMSIESYIDTAVRFGWKAIAITDHGVVQAFPNAQKKLDSDKLNLKIIFGMEGYLIGDDFDEFVRARQEEARQRKLARKNKTEMPRTKKLSHHIILLAKNREGLHNLYKLVSLSHLRFFYSRPNIPKKVLKEFREGLIIGSACEQGEVFRAIIEKRPEEEILEIASFYDYLEIQPVGNNRFYLQEKKYPDIQTEDDLRKINLKIAEIAQKLNKRLVATCDVHFLNPEDDLFRAVIQKSKGFDDVEHQPPLFLHTTEEMLEEFSYLGKDLAYEAVVKNPQAIADEIEKLRPIPKLLYAPKISGAEEEIQTMALNKAHELYGDVLPDVVQARLDQELKPIIGHGFSVLYLIAHKLVAKSIEDGYLVGSRGSVGSSFVATMTDITEVNPLPPHYRCPKCKYSEFITDGSVGCGYDLPNKNCPVCGERLIKDGHDIPFAVFLGFDGDKVPDIDLNFASVYQAQAQKYTKELFGQDNAYRAGTISTVADKTAYGFVRKFFEEKQLKKRDAFLKKIALGCTGTKRTTGQHPAGIMVVPRGMDIHFFTPIQHPANKKESGTITTHFDYHSINDRLVKLDNLGHDDPTMIKRLEILTKRDPKTIPFDDEETMKLFSSTKPLGLTPEELGTNSGTFGIPEFRTNFTRQMIDDTHPKCFSDLVRISGFSHGTNVWLDNAQSLIKIGTCTLKDAISARDDIMMYLIHKGIEPLLAFKTMERVRKGKGIDADTVEILKKGGIPDWYIESCQKIKYLFPRAHATAYVMMAFRIAYCKVHYPLAFYAAYFSIRAEAFDVDIIARGKEVIQNKLAQLKNLEMTKQNTAMDDELHIVLEIALEMVLRGFSVEHVDLEKSDAENFILLEKSLLPPFTALKGFGSVAAKNLVKERKKGAFTSVQNLHRRVPSVTKPNLELLRAHGCFQNLRESEQETLFQI